MVYGGMNLNKKEVQAVFVFPLDLSKRKKPYFLYKMMRMISYSISLNWKKFVI